MAHPKRRHSNARTAIRRSHDFLTVKSASKCSQCGAAIVPHRVCKHCGYYKGRQVISIKVKADASAKS